MFSSLHNNNKLQASSLGLNEITFSVIVFLIYSMSWLFFWFLPIQESLINYASMVFIPVGIRVSALLFLNLKYWPVIIAAEFSCALVTFLFLGVDVTGASVIVNIILPITVYASFIFVHLRTFGDVSLQRAGDVFKLLFTLILATMTFSSVMNLQRFYDEKIVFSNELVLTFFAFMFGDMMGILIVLPIVYLTVNYRQIFAKESKLFLIFNPFQVLCLSGIIVLMFAVSLKFEALNYIKIVMICFMLFLTYQYRLVGAIISIICCVLTIILYSNSVTDIFLKVENQTFLVSISVLSLLMASLVSENKLFQSNLSFQNIELSKQRQSLSQSLESNRLLTKQMISLQEVERQKIAKDLHDEIGQNLAVMSIELRLLLNESNNPKQSECIQNIQKIKDIINQTTHKLMNDLHPRGLTELGLFPALEHGQIATMLEKANIKLKCHAGALKLPITPEQALGLYRIIQEAASNSVKYSKGTLFEINSTVFHNRIVITISDNGNGIPHNHGKGLGLIGIKERVIALNGSHYLESDHTGTLHRIELPIELGAVI